MIYAAIVREVMTDPPGVRVQFKDLVRSGFAQYDFARVMVPKMAPLGGASSWLPEVGEFGIVAELDGGYYVWLGALPFMDKNQSDPTPGIAYLKHQSGVVLQVRQNGDFEVAHPSGLRLTVSRDGAALPALQASSNPPVGDTVVPILSLVHPSGAEVKVDADGHGLVHGFASLTFQDGDKRFSMEGLFSYVKDTLVPWIKGHKHTATGATAITTVPTSLPEDPVDSSCLSPAAFKGPQGA
jgi:hypothetical protein